MGNILKKSTTQAMLAVFLLFTACEDKSIDLPGVNGQAYQAHKPEPSPFINGECTLDKVKKLEANKRYLRRIDLALRKDREPISCGCYDDLAHSAPYSGQDFYDWVPVLFDSPDPVHCPFKIGMQLYEYKTDNRRRIPPRERTRIKVKESTPLKLQSITKFGVFTAIEQELGSSEYHTPLGRRIITVDTDGIIIDIEECQKEDSEPLSDDYLKVIVFPEERLYKVGEKVFFYLDLPAGLEQYDHDNIEWELNFGDGIIKYGLIKKYSLKDFKPITYHTYSEAGTYTVIFSASSRFGIFSSVVSKLKIEIAAFPESEYTVNNK